MGNDQLVMNIGKINSEMKVVASIEARMGSSRLPGKAMMKFGNKPALQLLVERLSRSKFIDEIVIATTVNPLDDVLEELGNSTGTKVFRGSEEDVLGRVVGAVEYAGGDVIVEITGDCPLLDPEVVDYVVNEFLTRFPKYDYVTNIGYVGDEVREIPLGMDVRVFTYKDLKHISEITNDPEDREHVSLYFFRGGKDIYKLLNVKTPDRWKRIYNPRLTLDTKEDYEMLSRVYNELSNTKSEFGLTEILNYLDSNKDMLEINSGVTQKKVKHLD